MDLVTYLQRRLPAFLNDLRRLTAIDSGTHNPAGVNELADLMAQRLAKLGCSVTRYACESHGLGDSVAGVLQGRGRARIFLIGHMDTVYANGTAASRPLSIESGRAIGPGTCDMKGGLLTGLFALEALQHIGFDNFAQITFFCNGDEEINSPCSRYHYLPLVQPCDAALVLEAGWPGGQLPYGALTVARKGGGQFVLHVEGVEAHSGSEFERGASAVLALARKIEDLHALTGRWPGVTVNVGVIRGGATHNTVAGQACADIDVRVSRSQDVPHLLAACQEITTHCHVPGTSAHLQGSIAKPPMERSASTFLAQLARQEAEALGFVLAEFTSGGTSDANYIAAAGVPVLDGLGPVGAMDHSPQEYLLVDAIVPRIALLAHLIVAVTQKLAS
jgi:glutamate carboxypeptidase